jgi:hypothetical protein
MGAFGQNHLTGFFVIVADLVTVIEGLNGHLLLQAVWLAAVSVDDLMVNVTQKCEERKGG